LRRDRPLLREQIRNDSAPTKLGLDRVPIGLATLLIMLWALSAQAATTFTGDKIQGLPVIAKLDIKDLKPGKTQRFMFQGVEMGSGEFWYVPVIVAKGAKPGKRILLVSSVHGDELNSVGAVQKVSQIWMPRRCPAMSSASSARTGPEWSGLRANGRRATSARP
jgi:hypothetical protein